MDQLRLSGNALKTGLMCLLFLATSSFAQNDPLVLQQLAIKRIDAYTDFARKSGDLKSRIPDLMQADSELAESNSIFETRNEWSALALGLIKQGTIHRLQDQWSTAIPLYQKAIEAAKRCQNIALQAESLAALALTESFSKNYGQALTDATEAVRLADISGDNKILASALCELTCIQVNIHDFDGAAESVNREIEIAKKSKDLYELFRAYHNRSQVYRGIARQCDYKPIFEVCNDAIDQMIADCKRAVDLAKKLGLTFYAQVMKTDIDEGENLKRLYKLRKKSITTYDGVNWHPKNARDVLVTQIFIFPGDPRSIANDELKQLMDEVIKKHEELYKKTGVHLINETTYTVEGQMKQFQGDNKAALSSFLKAVDVVEHDRRTLPSEQSRVRFQEDKSQIYYNAILQLLEQQRYAEAFEIFERARCRTLADIVADRRLSLSRTDEKELYGDMVNLRARIASAKGKMLELAYAADAEKHSKEIEKLQKEIASYEAEHDKVIASMSKESPRLKNLAVSEPASLAALQQSMREEGYEVLQYMVQGNEVILWHISPDSIYVCNVFLPQIKLTEKVSTLRKSLESQARTATFDETTARELFLYLIQPVLSRIKSDRLVIIPHEELNSLPFQVLQDPSDGRFLGERFKISYAPSASILLGLKRSSPLAGGRLLAVADPDIPFAVKEVQSIKSLFRDRCKVTTDSHPRECDVKNWVPDFDVVHLSVHGEFKADAPMLSYLKLGEGNGNDGKLTAAKMYGLSMDKCKLVVLSACETGKSEYTEGNESLGMVRGLLFAGANSLLLSNWRVDSEATALWMQVFYENALTRPLPEAAQAALIKVKGDPRYTHPRYWAAFTLIGR